MLQLSLTCAQVVHKKTGFTVMQKGGRSAYVLQVQTLMVEMHGAAANDLADGDSGCDNRSVRRARQPTAANGGGGRKRKAAMLTNDCGDEWGADEEFEVEAIVGTRVSLGVRAGDMGRKGEKLYRIIWKGYLPEVRGELSL